MFGPTEDRATGEEGGERSGGRGGEGGAGGGEGGEGTGQQSAPPVAALLTAISPNRFGCLVVAHHTWRSRGQRRRGRAAASAEGDIAIKACLLAVISVEISPLYVVPGASAIRVDSVRVVGARAACSLHKTAGPVRNGWPPAVVFPFVAFLARQRGRRRGR
eukprot:scaffold13191_cov69-Phaeocystis_antarctica.AAC.1